MKTCCCKRDFIHPATCRVLFIQGNFYEYTEEKIGNESFFIYYDKNGKMGYQGYRFFKEKSLTCIKKFGDYFYSERKMKLEKLKKLNFND